MTVSDQILSLILDEQRRQDGHFIDVPDLSEYLIKLASRAELVSLCSCERCRGFAAFYCNNFEDGVAYLTLLAVDPRDRGLGLGRALTALVLKVAKNLGFSKCRLEVRKENRNAYGMYVSLGFTIAEDRGEKYLLEVFL